jgi:hypothetical protein
VGEHLPLLPTSYYLDESDPDLLVLRRSDSSFVAAFSARSATAESIVEVAKEDYERILDQRLMGGETPSIEELPKHVAIVDGSGCIVAVNEAWRRFTRENGGDPEKVGVGTNYLDVCDRASGEQSEYAKAFAKGLRSVLSDREARFTMEYPCHSPTERRWFVVRVSCIAEGNLPMAVVAHENITGRKLLREQ